MSQQASPDEIVDMAINQIAEIVEGLWLMRVADDRCKATVDAHGLSAEGRARLDLLLSSIDRKAAGLHS